MADHPKAKAVRFEIEHEDGSIWRLTGEEARRHIQAINRLCAFACARGAAPGEEPRWEFSTAGGDDASREGACCGGTRGCPGGMVYVDPGVAGCSICGKRRAPGGDQGEGER